jgi:hypothetical protein
MNGLEVRQIKKHGFLGRLFGRTDRRNAIVALQNVLATTAISEIPPDTVDRVFELSDAETADLRRLGELFGLSDAQVRGAERTVLEPMYRGALKEAASDRVLTDDADA